MKNAFITGVSGHLGSCLVRYLLKDNWTVKCLFNNETPQLYSDGEQSRDYVYIDALDNKQQIHQ